MYALFPKLGRKKGIFRGQISAIPIWAFLFPIFLLWNINDLFFSTRFGYMWIVQIIERIAVMYEPLLLYTFLLRQRNNPTEAFHLLVRLLLFNVAFAVGFLLLRILLHVYIQFSMGTILWDVFYALFIVQFVDIVTLCYKRGFALINLDPKQRQILLWGVFLLILLGAKPFLLDNLPGLLHRCHVSEKTAGSLFNFAVYGFFPSIWLGNGLPFLMLAILGHRFDKRRFSLVVAAYSVFSLIVALLLLEHPEAPSLIENTFFFLFGQRFCDGNATGFVFSVPIFLLTSDEGNHVLWHRCVMVALVILTVVCGCISHLT